MTDERRHYSRIAFHAPASLVFPDSTSAVVVVDLSLKGALIRVPENASIKCGEICMLHVFLNESEIYSSIEGKFEEITLTDE